MVVEQFKKLWLPRGVDFMIVPELSADHCSKEHSEVVREPEPEQYLRVHLVHKGS